MVDSNTEERIQGILHHFKRENSTFDQTMDELFDVIKEELDNKENKVDRVKDWDEFANYMHKYIEDKTVSKYGQKSSGMDLMSVTNPEVCLWNMFKYILRLWNNSGKRYDIEKIIHYAQMAITLSEGDLTKCGVRESENPNRKFWLIEDS